LQGAKDAFLHYKGLNKNLDIYCVPGAFEIPGTIQQILYHKKSHAIVALGSVIRGETSHFDFVAGESAHGISQISRNTDIPIINGILTTDNMDQAMARSEPGNGQNKGWEAMEAALHMISVYRQIQISK
jgi:6,7-dimethyl-8-ribityllumazine synthase